ncbi:MAG: stage V sporulation protein AA [Candidatus Metalachnospira sp.]|nr:stage V sporulation protein AA [Candidatus Metalachnospira sp.]
MDVFIKPVKKTCITGRKAVMLKDVAEVYCQDSKVQDLGELIIFDIPKDEKEVYLISVMDIIKAIDAKLPNATINNIGEMDTVIEYKPKPEKNSKSWQWIKVAFVCITLFGGAMTAIMSFHSDAQIPDIFSTMYRIFFGVETDKPYIIFIPYSIGLSVGIIVFFNHIMGRKLTIDPTPIEVEMTTYDKEVIESMIDNLSKEKKQ